MYENIENIVLQNPVVLFDGVCNLCNGAVQYIIENDKENRFRFASLQSEVVKTIFQQINAQIPTLDSIILIETGKVFAKSEAVIRIAQILNIYPVTLYLCKLFPTQFLDFIYDIVAKNRYRLFGKKEQCMVPNENLKDKFLF